MKVIQEVNINSALSEALYYMNENGKLETSRNGNVLVSPVPVTTVYSDPTERVLFSPLRNANPFFHLMEALWMLSGRQDLEWPRYFNKRFSEYSDDNATLRGAYGYRWRNWFNRDQLPIIIKMLKETLNTRRAVLGMWDPENDLGAESNDIPCNTHIYFGISDNKLNMTVCCRSNDLWWGAYGANMVHFSILQEYIAAHVGVKIGTYTHLSNNFHLYTDIVPIDKLHKFAEDANINDRYLMEGIIPSPLFATGVDPSFWDDDLKRFMQFPDQTAIQYEHDFFNNTAQPIYSAWKSRKDGMSDGLMIANGIEAEDWRIACVEWIKRAEERKEK